MNTYALYLRKSRADLDAEARGEGETLAKHRAALTDYARRRGLFIAREYAEIISGDSIAARPQMQALLADVKAGMYTGVLVNDIDRLGRGDSIDQEIIKLTFAASHTLIITPSRDIDPANPTDDDMLDFSMFMARFEYKKISQRLREGRTRSVAAGHWVAGNPPYGYRLEKSQTGTTLAIDEKTAPIVRLIFEWYAKTEAGYQAIASRLNAMGIQFTPGHAPRLASVRNILKNPVYVGRLVWGRRSMVSVIEDGRRVKRQIKSPSQLIVEAAFPALINAETWQAVQNRINDQRHKAPINTNAVMQNPLSGLIVCGECGHIMVRTNSRGRRPLLTCTTPDCPTSATYLEIVENALLEILEGWCADYIQPEAIEKRDDHADEIAALRRQIATARAQITRAQELVETGIYSPSDYMSRRMALDAQISAAEAEADKLSSPSPEAARAAILPRLRTVLDAYRHAPTAADKNALLRTLLDHVTYHKIAAARRSADKNPRRLLSLDVFPRLY